MKNTLQLTTPSDREIVFTRLFNAPRNLVFDAFTKPALIQRWLLGPPGWTMPVCEFDACVGGKFRYVWRNAEGHDMGMGGVIREFAPPERLVCTEMFDVDWTGGETLGTLVFTASDGQTTLTQTVLYSSREARDGALKTGMEQGMAFSYDRLEATLLSDSV